MKNYLEIENPVGLSCDNSQPVCRATHKASLPKSARLPINRCNLPAVVLGGLTFQENPSPLLLDGIAELHQDLFRRLNDSPVATWPTVFRDYMTVHFRLEWPEQIGLTDHNRGRVKANYSKLIRGWSFDSDSREGAVLKGWVESRFGLMPRYHRAPLRDTSSDVYRLYEEQRAQGLYGTNALEAQLDLVYTFCQLSLAAHYPGRTHLTLYRGVNRLSEHEVLESGEVGGHVVLLNNLNSFTCSRERAGEFGDYILSVAIPMPKVFFYHQQLPGLLQGEDEFLVLGGVVNVGLSTI